MPQSTPPNCELLSIRGAYSEPWSARAGTVTVSDSDSDLKLNRAAVLHEGFGAPLENRIGCGG